MKGQDHIYSIRAVVFQDRGWWVAQCLEHDFCSSARKREDLPRKLSAQLRAQIFLDLLRGRRPFSAVPRAPEKFWRLYETGTPVSIAQKDYWLARLLGRLRGVSGFQTNLILASI